jgi:hypothetical protein
MYIKNIVKNIVIQVAKIKSKTTRDGRFPQADPEGRFGCRGHCERGREALAEKRKKRKEKIRKKTKTASILGPRRFLRFVSGTVDSVLFRFVLRRCFDGVFLTSSVF